MTRPLDSLFDPASVAIIGASADPGKWGHLLARGALAGEHRRKVYLVNRRGGEILGRPVFPALRELPAPPELVVVSVPPAHYEAAVDDALEAGARAIVGITSGVPQSRDAAIAERVRAAGAALLGPNCLGVFDGEAELHLAPWIEFPPGRLGLIAQSGNLALELGLLAQREGVGVSRFASLGNQADVEPADLLANLASHDATRLIALYVEDFGDGRAFAQIAQATIAEGKPVVLLAGGTSPASARAARSHTGALVSELTAIDAACRAAGIVRVSTPRELVDVAKALLDGRRSRGRCVAVFGDGGGHGVVAADVAASHGLELPVLSDALRSELAAVLPAGAATTNPIDFAGAGEKDLATFEQVSRVLLDSEEVDALLLTGYFGGYGGEVAELAVMEVDTAVTLARTAAARGRTLVVHTLYPDSAAADALRREGALVYREIERAVTALHALATADSPRVPMPTLPEPLPGDVGDDSYLAARALVAKAGIPVPESRPVSTLANARIAAAELGYPLVLKTLAREHKSDAGGVVLGIDGPAELAQAYESLAGRLGPECSLERLEPAEHGLELIVGVRRDRRFGPLLLVGLGGIYAELIQDTAVALAPVAADEAEALLRSLRCAPILDGVRGRPALDVRAAARAAAALSLLAAARPQIDELEVNPLLVRPDGVVALDARVLSVRP